jgi:hypothetical protein
MTPGLVQVLLNAADNGEIVTALYHAGSQPGAKRELLPLRVTKTKLWARCLASNEEKSFFLKHLEIVPEEYSAPQYVSLPEDNRKPPKEFDGLEIKIDITDIVAKELAKHRLTENPVYDAFTNTPEAGSSSKAVALIINFFFPWLGTLMAGKVKPLAAFLLYLATIAGYFIFVPGIILHIISYGVLAKEAPPSREKPLRSDAESA